MGDSSVNHRRLARRRRANVQGGRQLVKKVRLSPEEAAVLYPHADELGVSVQRLLVDSALHRGESSTMAERGAVIAQLFQLTRVLGAVSNNVNQIAKASNATHEVQQDEQITLLKLRELLVRIDDAVDSLSGGQ